MVDYFRNAVDFGRWAKLTIYGLATVNDAGVVNVGDAAGLKANITNEGTFNLTTDAAGIGLNAVNVGGSLQSGIANFDNYEGTLAKTGGTGTSHFGASYATTAGTISVSTGTLEFDGSSNTFSSGTISGTGTIAFGAGNSQFSINPTIANFLIDGDRSALTPRSATPGTSRKQPDRSLSLVTRLSAEASR